VDYSGAMGIPDTGTSLQQEMHGVIDGVATILTDEVLQVVARQVFHDNEKPAGIVTKIMNGDDIGMGEIGRRFGFQAKLFAEPIIVRIILAQQFDGYQAFEHCVFRFVNHGHSTRSERIEQAVTMV
jgi:hypothetical protein